MANHITEIHKATRERLIQRFDFWFIVLYMCGLSTWMGAVVWTSERVITLRGWIIGVILWAVAVIGLTAITMGLLYAILFFITRDGD